MENPYRSATRYSSMILSETSWSPRELLKSIGGEYIPTLFHKFELY